MVRKRLASAWPSGLASNASIASPAKRYPPVHAQLQVVVELVRDGGVDLRPELPGRSAAADGEVLGGGDVHAGDSEPHLGRRFEVEGELVEDGALVEEVGRLGEVVVVGVATLEEPVYVTLPGPKFTPRSRWAKKAERSSCPVA